MRLLVLRKQRSSLGRTAFVRDAHGYRVYLPGPYLVQVRRRTAVSENPPVWPPGLPDMPR